jgi:hypothetical protein
MANWTVRLPSGYTIPVTDWVPTLTNNDTGQVYPPPSNPFGPGLQPGGLFNRLNLGPDRYPPPLPYAPGDEQPFQFPAQQPNIQPGMGLQKYYWMGYVPGTEAAVYVAPANDSNPHPGTYGWAGTVMSGPLSGLNIWAPLGVPAGVIRSVKAGCSYNPNAWQQ